MATDDDSDVPETGAVFTFGKSRFADNAPNKFWIRNDRVSHVACGDEHTALVADSGRIFTFGSNDWGQLGLGNTKQQTKPNCIKSLKKEKITNVTCGRTHTLVATESGCIYSFGANGENQLGRGDVHDTSVPGVIEGLETTQYAMLAGGTDHSVALTEDGRVFVWGGSSDGQLGLGDVTECPTPTQLKLDEKVVHISCGYYHTAFVTESGKLLTCGESDGGKLGTSNDQDNTTPQHVDSIAEKVVSAACGGSHTVALTKCGKVYTFGDGSNGQLGHGNIVLQSSTPQVVTALKHVKVRYVSCGENHTAVVTEKGQMYCFGDGRHGKLGLGEENFANQFKPSIVPRFAKFVVNKVSCGGCHMLALAQHKQETENGDLDSEEEDEEEETPSQKNSLSAREEDLEGTFSARDRRRQNSPLPSLTRTLPPLNSTLINKSLPPLSATIGPSSLASKTTDNPLNRGRLPQIHISEPDAKKIDDDSDVSLTPEGESDSEEDINETRRKMKARSEKVSESKAAPVPKARPQPAPRLQKKVETAEETSKRDEEKKKKESNKKEKTEEDDDEEEEEDKKKKGKKKKSKEEDEEESEVKGKKSKDANAVSDVEKGKKKGLFSRSKFNDSEEDEIEDDTEEELEELKNEIDVKSKKQKEKEDKEKSKKEKEKEEKEKDKKGKEKKDKEEKGKKKTEKEEEKEAEKEDSKEKDAEKEAKEEKKEPPKKEEKKKSSLCTVL